MWSRWARRLAEKKSPPAVWVGRTVMRREHPREGKKCSEQGSSLVRKCHSRGHEKKKSRRRAKNNSEEAEVWVRAARLREKKKNTKAVKDEGEAERRLADKYEWGPGKESCPRRQRTLLFAGPPAEFTSPCQGKTTLCTQQLHPALAKFQERTRRCHSEVMEKSAEI